MKIRKRQKGMSLIEALIAIVVFALGMLGQVAFMMTSMQSNQQSRYRAIASYYAEEMIGMALADISNRSKYAVSATACSDTAFTPCTQWLNRLKTDLPQISTTATPVSIAIDNTSTSTTFGKMDITIQWKATDGSSAQQYKTTTNLNLIDQ